MRLGDPDRPDGRGVDEPLDLRLQRLFEHDPRAAQVDVEDGAAIAGPQRGAPGDVKDRSIPFIARRTARRSVMSPVARSNSTSSSWSRFELPPSEQAQLVAARGERAHEVRAEEPAAPGDQGLGMQRPRATARDRGRGHADLIRTRVSAPEDRGRHRHHRLSARGADRRARHPSGQPLRHPRRRAAPARAEIEAEAYGDFYERLRAQRAAARPPRSPRSATSSPSTSRCSPPGHEIVSIHISAGISGTCRVGAPGAPAADRLGQGRRADHGLRQPLGLWRPGADGDGRESRRRRGRRRRRRGDRGRRAGPRLAEDVVRDRHARVPAQGRPDRRRAGAARLGAADQADPHPGGGDHPGRARPHPAAGVRADGRVRPRAQARRAPTPGSSSTSTIPTPPGGWSTNAARCSARTRSSSPRSGP